MSVPSISRTVLQYPSPMTLRSSRLGPDFKEARCILAVKLDEVEMTDLVDGVLSNRWATAEAPRALLAPHEIQTPLVR